MFRFCLAFAIAAHLLSSGPAAAVEGATLDHRDLRAAFDGEPGEPITFPEVGVVRTRNASCFGTLIASDLVLTSAICVDAQSMGQREISANLQTYFGTSDGKTQLRCVPVGDKPIDQYSLVLCQTSGMSPSKEFAVLAEASGAAGERANLMGRICDSTSFDLASRVAPIRIAEDGHWIAEGVGPCPGDQGAPAFRVSEVQTWERRQISGVIVGVIIRSKERSLVLAPTQLDAATMTEFALAADRLNAKICGVNRFDPAYCHMRPVPDDDANPEGQPNTLSVEMIGVSHGGDDTLLDLMERSCKFATPQHLTQMEAMLGPEYLALIRQKFGTEGVASLPACPNVTRIDQREIVAGDAASKYFNRDANHLGFLNLGPEDGSDLDSYMGVFWRINPSYKGTLQIGGTVNIPVIEMPVVIAPRDEDDSQRNVAEGRALLVASIRPTSTSYACSDPRPTDPMRYPFDVAELVSALHNNQVLRSGSGDTADIVIADTGVFLKPRPSGGQEYFNVANPDDNEALPQTGGEVDVDVEHGTEVASVALGGPFLAQLWALTEKDRIKIRSIRIFDYNQDFRDYSTQRAAIKSAAQDAANIINYSVTSIDDTMFEPIVDAQAQKWPLFVVAAGNNGDSTAAATSLSYPGDMGGDQRHNLISVANLDGTSKRLHKTSSFHPRNVDIAAPGCEIPVIGWGNGQYVQTSATGTSVAAPLVSFAAGLVFGEGRDTSAEAIKRRLMISADLSPMRDPNDSLHVSNTVRDGRRLNIVKAVSLHEDLIELPDDFGTGTQILHGKVTLLLDNLEDPQKSIPFTDCADDGDLLIKPDNILKLWPFAEGDRKRVRIYYQNKESGPVAGDPLFEAATCARQERLTLRIVSGGDSVAVNLGTLLDFVKSSR